MVQIISKADVILLFTKLNIVAGQIKKKCNKIKLRANTFLIKTNKF